MTTYWSIWRFRNVAGTETKIIVRSACPGEERFQNEYNQLLDQVWAHSRQEALREFAAGQGVSEPD